MNSEDRPITPHDFPEDLLATPRPSPTKTNVSQEMIPAHEVPMPIRFEECQNENAQPEVGFENIPHYEYQQENIVPAPNMYTYSYNGNYANIQERRTVQAQYSYNDNYANVSERRPFQAQQSSSYNGQYVYYENYAHNTGAFNNTYVENSEGTHWNGMQQHHAKEVYDDQERFMKEWFVDPNAQHQPINENIQVQQYDDDIMIVQPNQENYGTSATNYSNNNSIQHEIIELSDDDDIEVIEQCDPLSKYFPNSTSTSDSAGTYPDQGANIGPIKTKKRICTDKSKIYSEKEIDEILKLKLVEGDEIFTKNLSRRILYELYARGIPQEKFARSVIGRAQGTFSALVTHPKKWSDMKTVGRMPYLKMKKWLDLTEDEKKAVLERTTETAAEKTTQKPVMKTKRTRTVFTQAQRDALDAYFATCPNAWKPELEGLAYQLRLPWDVVSTYFTNQRSKQNSRRNQQQ